MKIVNSNANYVICSAIKLTAPEDYYHLAIDCPSCIGHLWVYYHEEDNFILHPCCAHCNVAFHVVWDADIHDYHAFL